MHTVHVAASNMQSPAPPHSILYIIHLKSNLKSRRRDLRLALVYKVVMGHVGIQPEHVGLVAADDRTRAKHQFKFRAVGSSTQAFRHSFAVRTSNRRRLELASVPCGGTVNSSIF